MIGLATGALLAAVWQGVLLAAVVWLVLRMLPKTPAAVRFAIWFGVFLVVTALPVTSLWPHAARAMRAGGRGAWMTLDLRWSLVIAAVWGAASLVRAAKLVVAAVRVRGLWRRATPVVADQAAAPLSAASNMGLADSLLSRRAQLCVSDEVDRPTVIGFFAPKIVIPGWLLEKLTPAELDQIVLHEASHLGRADDWMNLLQKIALVIFPLNPALAWVERRLCFERELAVDERVLRAFAGKSGAATAYASCLVTVAGHRLGRRGLALALGALGRESELGRRVGRILRRGEMMRPTHARLLMGGAVMALLAATAGLERCPELVGFASGTPTVAQADVVNLERPMISRVMLHKNAATAGIPREVLTTASMRSAAGSAGGSHPTTARQPSPDSGESHAVTNLIASVPQPILRDETAKETLAKFPVDSPKFSDRQAGFSDHLSKFSNSIGVTDAAHAVAKKADPRPAPVMQWLVVTEWQSTDGAARTSRMVMTTAPVENPAVKGQRMRSDVAPPPQQDLEQVRPYAAVPVMGGWLVFQL